MCDLGWKTVDFDWVPVPVRGFKSQSELYNFSWKKLTVKSVNYKNVKKKKLQQGQNEKPAVFEGRLVEAFRKHTNENPPLWRDTPF